MTMRLELTLYNEENEAIKTYTRLFVPWKLLKRAVKLSKIFGSPDFSADQMTDEDIDSLAALVIETFGNQFTLEQLDSGADLGEMMTVLTGIMASAQGIVPNGPPRENP